jgi:hypothetical protein
LEQLVILLPVSLESAKNIRQVLWRRRDKYRLVKSTAGRTDPVLALPQFSSSEIRTSDTGEQFSMDFADEADRDGKIRSLERPRFIART